MVAVPPAVPVGIEPEMGPPVGHGEDEVHVAAPAGCPTSSGTPVTTWTTLKVPSAAASEPAPAAATASDRSSAPSAASKDSTHSGER